MNTKEAAFEYHIVNYLIKEHGYVERQGAKKSKQFHLELVLDSEQVVAFLTATQADEWTKLEKIHGVDQVKSKLLTRLARVLSQEGTLWVLRNGIKDNGCHFDLFYRAPVSTLNPDHQKRVAHNTLSVMRQCHYSAKNSNSLDLVIFINGLPIFTIELKNKLTGQTRADAIIQYQKDRSISGEPLLAFKRCLVHFAVDGDEVYMTTHLQGTKTRFLPFNQGNRGHAGNPPNPYTYPSHYLWQSVLGRDSVLELLTHFIHIEIENKEGKTTEKLIFPRYHQRDAVQKLLAHTLEYGVGNYYLIQHSAGSGKSNTIAWLAHRLAGLHNDENQRVFDKVIVITDRRVLDRQLQDTIRQFQQTAGVVAAIDKDSDQLATALKGTEILIVTTLQKFPFIIDKVRELKGLNFAIIADEAHSSQTGETSKAVREALGDYIADDAPDPETMDGEDLIQQSIDARGKQPNLSFYAFTATPKEKTLETFGVKRSDGEFYPFHLYEMRQAIEENFILDVLQHYITYQTWFELLKQVDEDPLVPKSRAMGQLKAYVEQHEETIARKTITIVEHFHATIASQIPDDKGDGRAKAMIVTRSRLHAVRYKRALDRYFKERGYPYKALVAFSGMVKDGGKEYTEATMNGFSDARTAEEFKKPAYRFMIVAEKFQTGFDQPLLHTMYVDKVLTGVAAVQTLSRLNRTYPGKTDTMVLDFANTADNIQKAFQPYYTTTILSEATDPNRLYDFHYKLLGYHLCTQEEAREVAIAYLRNRYKRTADPAMYGKLTVIVDRYNGIEEQPTRREFKSDLRDFINLYAFLRQIIPFRDGDLESFYLFARLLLTMLPPEEDKTAIRVKDSVDLGSYKIDKQSEGRIHLADTLGSIEPIGSDSQQPVPDELAYLSEIIATLNDRFGTAFSDDDRVFFAQLTKRLTDNDTLQQSAKVNPRDNVRLLYKSLFQETLRSMIDTHFDMYKRINDNGEFGDQVRDAIFRRVYDALMRENGELSNKE